MFASAKNSSEKKKDQLENRLQGGIDLFNGPRQIQPETVNHKNVENHQKINMAPENGWLGC